MISLNVDGYAEYNGLGIEHVACMAGVCCKFFKAARFSKTLDTRIPMKLLDEMFALDAQ